MTTSPVNQDRNLNSNQPLNPQKAKPVVSPWVPRTSKLETGIHHAKPMIIGKHIKQNLNIQQSSNKPFRGKIIERTQGDSGIPLTTSDSQIIYERANPKQHSFKNVDSQDNSPKNQAASTLETKYVFEKSDKFKRVVRELKNTDNYETYNIISKQGSTATAPTQYFKDKKFYAISKTVAEGTVGVARQLEKWIKASSIAQRYLGMRRPTTLLPGGVPEAKGFAEMVAWQRSKFKNTHLVPETHFVKKSTETVQLSAGKRTETLKDEMKNGLPLKVSDEGRKSYFSCIYESYANGGLDCHLGNIMSKRDKNGQIVKYQLIDNGNSFFVKFPTKEDTLIIKNYCGWKDYPLSKEKVPQKFKDEMLKSNYCKEEENIRFLLKQKEASREKCKDPRPGHEGKDFADTFFSDEMIICDALRHRVLKKFTEQEDVTPADLAKIQTEEETWKFLTNDNPEKKKEILSEIQDTINKVKVEIQAEQQQKAQKRFAVEME